MALNIRISEAAAAFYRKEMNLCQGEACRIYVRVGGLGNGGYSCGVAKAVPSSRDHVVEVGGVSFFVAPDDAWYLDGMRIELDNQQEIVYRHQRFQELHHPLEKQNRTEIGENERVAALAG
jgi:uncharacterized protein YneR